MSYYPILDRAPKGRDEGEAWRLCSVAMTNTTPSEVHIVPVVRVPIADRGTCRLHGSLDGQAGSLTKAETLNVHSELLPTELPERADVSERSARRARGAVDRLA